MPNGRGNLPQTFWDTGLW